MRLRLIDFRLSRGANSVGLCSGNIAEVSDIVNSAQERLITARESGDAGWFGSWAKVVYNVSASNPYITQARGHARIINTAVCNRAISIQNEWFEELEFGYGIQPNFGCSPSPVGCQFLEMYDRGFFPTFSDLQKGKTLRIYTTDASDAGKRVLIQGTDQNDSIIYGQDGIVPCLGEFVTLEPPFAQFPMTLNSLTGIQKDITTGPLKFYETDSVTGDTRLILTMEPSEEVASYRRYFLNGLPSNCCNNPNGTAQVTAMVKLDFIPAKADTDWLMFHSPGGLEALIAEAQCQRFDGMDSASSDNKMLLKHRQAIGYLQGQLTHFFGKSKPAVVFAPFGSARLERQGIGKMI